MSQSGLREVEHEITVSAPATAVYHLIADVTNWPRIFPPTIHVDRTPLDGNGNGEERIHIWATANGEPKNWTSHRVLDPGGLRIAFRQETTAPPVAAMGGAWIIEPHGSTACRVRLQHHYRAVDDDPGHLDWIDQAVDHNSRTELAALKTNLERAHTDAALTFSFEDTVHTTATAKDLYDFVNEAHLWSERLPHVAAVRLSEDVPGLQELRMDTIAKDGSVHTTASYRVTSPHHRIVYKQTTLPALMALHTGRWTFTDTPRGATAASQHTVTVNTAGIARVLGPHATVEDAKAYLHTALSTNSTATLNHAKHFAEQQAGNRV